MLPSRRATLFSVVLAASLATAADRALADCAVPRLTYVPAIEDGATLPARSPIVVFMHPHWGIPLGPVTYALTGPRHIALRLRTIAPDVALLEPVEDTPPGLYAVDGLVTPLHVRYAPSALPAVPLAPVSTGATHVSLGLDRHAGERFQTRATLGSDVPAGVVMVLVHWRVGGRTVGTSFHRVNPASRSIVLYESAEGCGTNPPGEAAPPAGAEAEIAWLDMAGRVGPWSNRFGVTFGPRSVVPTPP